jgi:transposase-like protein
MNEPEVFRICPHCASREVPKLIVRGGRTAGGGASWRCRSCDMDWSDWDSRQLRAG